MEKLHEVCPSCFQTTETELPKLHWIHPKGLTSYWSSDEQVAARPQHTQVWAGTSGKHTASSSI